jgi:acetylornithine/succinyldiaminopimelate/putrescine aminotransferase
MVAGLATLTALDETGAVAEAERMGGYLLGKLQDLVGPRAFLQAVRGRGLNSADLRRFIRDVPDFTGRG